MPQNNGHYGPTGTDEITGYRVSPLEHRIRLGYLVGGRDTGKSRAETAISDAGRSLDIRNKHRKAHESAIQIINDNGLDLWEPYSIVRNEDQKTSVVSDFEMISEDEHDGPAKADYFMDASFVYPHNLVCLEYRSQSSGKISIYPLLPADLNVVCSCPAKHWQEFILCKHEIVALIAIHEDEYPYFEGIPEEHNTHVSKSSWGDKTVPEP